MTFNKCSISGTTYGDPLDERGLAVDVTEVWSIVHVLVLTVIILNHSCLSGIR